MTPSPVEGPWEAIDRSLPAAPMLPAGMDVKMDGLLNDNLVGGFNPFEKYYIVKLDHFPK